MSFDHMSEEERAKVAAQVDYFVSVMMRRYGMTEEDVPKVLDSLRWLREHRAFMQRIQTGGTLSLIALLVSALAAAVWEGMRSLLAGER